MNRLREYQRGTLAAGGASIASEITLPGTFEMYSWNLDSVGNWKKTTQTPVAGSETTEARHHNKLHQITKAGPTALTHDSSGNITDDGSRLLAYDAMNRVKTITRKSDSAILGTYTYDAFGRRIQKVIADLGGGQGGLSGNITAGTTDYLYDGMQCVEERVIDSMTKQFVWGLYIDELLEIKTPSNLYYPLQDLLYRTNVLTDSSGAIYEKFDYDAYGRTLIFDASDNAKSNPICEFLFTGRRFDPESELYFYRARYYNPELGRFLSRDPIGYKGGLGLYAYVGSNPMTGTDPMGMWRLWDWVLGVDTESPERQARIRAAMARKLAEKLEREAKEAARCASKAAAIKARLKAEQMRNLAANEDYTAMNAQGDIYAAGSQGAYEGAHDGALGYAQGVNEILSLGGNLYDPGDLSGIAYNSDDFGFGRIGGQVGGAALGAASLLAAGSAAGVTAVGNMSVGGFAAATGEGVFIYGAGIPYATYTLGVPAATNLLVQNPYLLEYGVAVLNTDPAIPASVAGQVGYLSQILIVEAAKED